MKRVLALQHVQENPPGLVGEVLRKHGIDYQIIQVTSEPIPDPKTYDAVIALDRCINLNHMRNLEEGGILPVQ